MAVTESLSAYREAGFLSIIEVSGDDRISFLQGQLTCDMEKISSHYQFAALCNPKGRVISLLYVYSSEESTLLIVPAELCEKLISHLSRFVFRSKVRLNLYESGIVYFKQSETTNIDQSNAVLSNSAGLSFNPDIQLAVSVRHSTLTDTDAYELWNQCMHELGIPWLDAEQSESYLPESLNLDLSGAISFDKGCYTGQEIIARMHYLGKAKKRLYKLRAADNGLLDKDLTAGSEIQNNQHRSVGTLFSVSAGRDIALAILDTGIGDTQTSLITADGTALNAELPAYTQ